MNGRAPATNYVGFAALLTSIHVLLEGWRHFGSTAGWLPLEPAAALGVEAILAWLGLFSAVWIGAQISPRWTPLWGVLALVLLQLGARTQATSATEATGTQTGQTLVLLTLDTLRRDHVSAYPGAVATDLTPNLDALMAQGTRFDGAVAPAPLTLPSHTSYLTGLSPWQHGAVRNGRHVVSDLPLWPIEIARRGFRTAAFTSSSVLDRELGLASGFQVYRDPPWRLAGARELWLTGRLLSLFGGSARQNTAPGTKTVERSLAWLDAQPEDASVLIWVHLYDAHQPYDADESWTGERTRSSLPHPCDYADHPAALRRGPPMAFQPHRRPLPAESACREQSWVASDAQVEGYARQVRLLDHAVGQLVKGLADRRRWSQTKLVAVADHGESLVEHQALVSHEYWLSEPVIRVPLMVVDGDCSDCVAVRSDDVQAERLAATFLSWAGVTSPDLGPPLSVSNVATRGAMGPAAHGRQGTTSMQVAMRDGPLKVIRAEGGYTERYDLSADPLEVHPMLSDADRDWLRTEIERRLAPVHSEALLLFQGPPVSDAERSSYAQPGLFGVPLTAESAVKFSALEARADAALESARRRINRSPEPQHDAALTESLRVLGYTE